MREITRQLAASTRGRQRGRLCLRISVERGSGGQRFYQPQSLPINYHHGSYTLLVKLPEWIMLVLLACSWLLKLLLAIFQLAKQVNHRSMVLSIKQRYCKKKLQALHFKKHKNKFILSTSYHTRQLLPKWQNWSIVYICNKTKQEKRYLNYKGIPDMRQQFP